MKTVFILGMTTLLVASCGANSEEVSESIVDETIVDEALVDEIVEIEELNGSLNEEVITLKEKEAELETAIEELENLMKK
jgi:hypothetical protein